MRGTGWIVASSIALLALSRWLSATSVEYLVLAATATAGRRVSTTRKHDPGRRSHRRAVPRRLRLRVERPTQGTRRFARGQPRRGRHAVLSRFVRVDARGRAANRRDALAVRGVAGRS